MNISGLIKGFIGDAQPSEPKTLELKTGEVVKGMVVQPLSENEAIVNIGGVQVRAKLETPLKQGEVTMLQVQPESTSGQIVLKPLDGSSVKIADGSLGELLKNLGMADNSANRQLLQSLHQAGIPLSKENVQAFMQLQAQLPPTLAQEQWVPSAALAFQKGIPLTPDSVNALRLAVSGPAFHETLQQLDAQLAKLLNDEPALSPSTRAAIDAFKQVVASLKEASGQLGAPQTAGAAGPAAAAPREAAVRPGAGTGSPQAAPASGTAASAAAGREDAATLPAAQAGRGNGESVPASPRAAAAPGGAAAPEAGAPASPAQPLPAASSAPGQPRPAGAAPQPAAGQEAPPQGASASSGGTASPPAAAAPPPAPAATQQPGAPAVRADSGLPPASGQADPAAAPAAGKAAAAPPAPAATQQPGELVARADGGLTPASGQADPAAAPAAGKVAAAPPPAPAAASQPAYAPSQANAPASDSGAAAAGAANGAPSSDAAAGEHWLPKLMKTLGVDHEHRLFKMPEHSMSDSPIRLDGGTAKDALPLTAAAQEQAKTADTLKSVLMQLAQANDIPPAMKESVHQAVQQLTGQQLMLNPDRGSMFSHITMFVPLLNANGEQTAAIHIQSRKGRRGELDAQNCRLVFDLRMKQLGHTMVDVKVVDRIVSLHVLNDQPFLQPLLESYREEIAAGLSGIGYQFISLKCSPYPEMAQGESPSVKPQDAALPGNIQSFYNQKQYKGMDVRV